MSLISDLLLNFKWKTQVSNSFIATWCRREKWVTLNQFNFFALKRCYTFSKLVGNWRLWKIESKHAQKLTISRFLSPFFSLNYVFFSHILSLYVFRRPALKTLKSCAEFDVGRFFWRILANVSPWFFQRKSLRFWEMAKTLDRVKKS